MSMISCSPPEVSDAPAGCGFAGGHDQGTVQDTANADDRIPVQRSGRGGDPRKEEPHWLPGSVVAGGDRRTRAQHHRTTHPRRTPAAHENPRGVRLYAITECHGSEDARFG